MLGLEFSHGYVKGWAFGVSEAFKTNLDIRFDWRADSEANKARKKRLGRTLRQDERTYRQVWTRGTPPAYSFARGHMFHEPPEAHGLPWDQALKVIRRTVIVLSSRPDAGALLEIPAKGDGSEGHEVIETEDRSGQRGWVEFTILHYDYGEIVHSSSKNVILFQSTFAEFLQTGM